MVQVEVLIVGGGIAGLTLAQWLSGLERRWLLLERGELGGCLRESDYPLKWVPGFADISGRDYVARLLAQVPTEHCRSHTTLASIAPSPAGGWQGTLSTGESWAAQRVVLACGVAPYAPFAPHPRLIVGPGLMQLAHLQAGDAVAILGGGDNALEHALLLHARGCVVTVYTRGAFRASKAMYQAASHAGISLQSYTPVDELADAPAGLCLPQLSGQPVYAAVAVYYGYRPPAILAEFPALRGASGAGLAAGVDMIGDMREDPDPNLLLAQGQAAQLAKQLDRQLA
ncbi:NAD(P)/FAD-dependent oxidoreductase [Chitinibacter tainanensis]|uniref:NAD(P)/FAD-dependent oxidoreductase n=1 Tax=Chitinibacter tainanensis TaxID=230667 RepID=UPI0023540FA9|nr:FAD-dependent oxidoreductase [Chitinibacter tainanensis]